MQQITGIAANKLSVASANLKPDMDRINKAIAEFNITLVEGTFNVDLSENAEYDQTDETTWPRSENETLYFQRCRLKKSDSEHGIRALLLRSSLHRNTIFKHTLEVMSSCHLRSCYGIEAGDKITIELDGDTQWWNRADDPKSGKAEDATELESKQKTEKLR